MKIKKYISYLLLSGLPAMMLFSCTEDKTYIGGDPISEIAIDENSVLPEYIVAKNDVLTITPVVTQSIAGKALSYEWEVEHEIFSTDEVFTYPCHELGTFDCRLIVSNEDGKAFMPFTINVNTPYEEGLVIISKDPTGKSRISFMLHNTDGSEDSFYEDDIFSLNNPEISFAPNVSDAIVSNGALIVSCKGDATTSPCIYYLNEKTMDLENYVNVPEYAGFEPRQLLICSYAFAGASYPVVSENGKIYDFASTEGTVVESSKFPSVYDPETAVFYDSGSGTSYNMFFWDTEDNVLVTMFNGYGGYYVLKNYEDKSDRNLINVNSNIFAMGKDVPVAMFIPRYTTRDLLRETPMIYIITESNGLLKRTAMNKAVWTYNSDTGKNVFDIRETLSPIGTTADSKLEKGAPMVAGNSYKSLFFAKGNEIYQWHYPQGSLSNATLFATVGNPGSIVTGMDLSADQSELYVASYDPTQPGLNGSCHIIEIKQTESTEEVYSGKITNFSNISYQPVKILYKKK